MTPPNGKQSFLDRGTITALVLVMVFWIAWSYIMERKYPQQKAPPATAAATTTTAPTTVTPSPTAAPETTTTTASSQETFVDYDDENLSFQISSKGMGLRNINVKAYTTRDKKPIVIGTVNTNYPFATALVEDEKAIDFAIEKTSEKTFVGRASVDGMTIQKTLTLDTSRYLISTDIQISGVTPQFKGLITYLNDTLAESSGGSFFAPALDTQDFMYLTEGSREYHVLHKKDGLEEADKNVNLAALSSHYFTLALVDRSPLMPRFEARIPANSPTAVGRLIYQPVNPSEQFGVKYDAFAGPKQLTLLTSVDPLLSKVINFGMFDWIARPLLWLLKWLNSFIHNYGWSIVVLTIIVRFLVLPFNVYSFRSMKVMQKLQPEMQRLRERYKDDPQTMNREVMDLMRRNKANPIGGCLPMLLQLPVFFALYQVLGQSIELYQAPWMLWITDLSSMDRFFVLPVLMGITMFIQQKITPTSMDPAQAKILMWMPIVFTFFMVSLPSGLTLYIFVSTLFGIIQQYIFMREKTPNAKVSHARA